MVKVALDLALALSEIRLKGFKQALGLGKILPCILGDMALVRFIPGKAGIDAEGVNTESVPHVVEEQTAAVDLTFTAALPSKDLARRDRLDRTVFFHCLHDYNSDPCSRWEYGTQT